MKLHKNFLLKQGISNRQSCHQEARRLTYRPDAAASQNTGKQVLLKQGLHHPLQSHLKFICAAPCTLNVQC